MFYIVTVVLLFFAMCVGFFLTLHMNKRIQQEHDENRYNS